MASKQVTLHSYVPTQGDYERVDALLTQFSKDQGGVDYEHIALKISDNDAQPKVQVTADFLSWGCVTLTDIEILNREGLSQASAQLFQKVRKMADEANMASIVIENNDANLEHLYYAVGFMRSANVPHADGLRKTFFLQSLEVNGDIILPNASNDEHSVLSGTSKPFAHGFTARDPDGHLLGELIALYNEKGEFEVERIFVDSTRRSNGAGRKLMQTAERFAFDINMKSILVASPTWQQGFVDSKGGFYEKVGYKRLAAIPLNLTRVFDNAMQYNVYYKKDLDTDGAPKADPAHLLQPL